MLVQTTPLNIGKELTLHMHFDREVTLAHAVNTRGGKFLSNFLL